MTAQSDHNPHDAVPPRPLGGVIHTYLGYDPRKFGNPTQPPGDDNMVRGAFEHMLMYGSTRALTEEELANAIHIDSSQIKGLGPSIDALIAMLEERKDKILAAYETVGVQKDAAGRYLQDVQSANPPAELRKAFERETRDEQIRDLERLWYLAERTHPEFAARLLHIIESLGDKYQIDELVSKYVFTGCDSLTIPEALQVKEELEQIDELLEQLKQARDTAQLAIVDMEALSEFAEPGDMEQLRSLQQQLQDYVRELAEQQGLEFTRQGYQLSPKAYRIFQGRLLEQIFDDLQAARSGRHTGQITGEGAVELMRTKPYEFGDSPAHMDVPQSVVNALLRGAERDANGKLSLHSSDIEIHYTRNTPKCATAVIMDMSGSMRYGGQYIHVKRMALALDGLIRSEYPGDYLQFIEMYTFAKPRHISEVPTLLPKPVTMYDSVIRRRADMSDQRISELDIPPHFTNIQHSLKLARQFLGAQDTPNRQIMLLTDGLPTAHFEGEHLYLLYPPDSRTEEQTMREANLCRREGITINIFLLPNWSQTEEDVQFAHRMAEATQGRVFFAGGEDLDRFVVWDYLNNRRRIVG